MEHTSSLTADRDTSVGSRFTVSLVRPICSRKDTPWKDSREWVGLGALALPLDRRPQSAVGGLAEGEGASGAAGCTVMGNGLGKDGGDELPHEDICNSFGLFFSTSNHPGKSPACLRSSAFLLFFYFYFICLFLFVCYVHFDL